MRPKNTMQNSWQQNAPTNDAKAMVSIFFSDLSTSDADPRYFCVALEWSAAISRARTWGFLNYLLF
jgi:UDP-3-O-acyl-N-acetylglucosamine deacetylase